MLHLEDYLDKLEHLPQKMRTGLTKLREMDLHVESSMTQVKKKVDDLFSIANGMNPYDLEFNFNQIIKEGEKSIELSEGKVQLANNMHTLMIKYLEELDQDINKCEMELEAKNSGICKIIEKRSLDLEPKVMTVRKEKDNYLNRCLFEDNTKVLKKCNSSKRNLNYTINEEFIPSFQNNTNTEIMQMIPLLFTQKMDNMKSIIPVDASQNTIATKELSQTSRTIRPKVSLNVKKIKNTLKDKSSSNLTLFPSKLPFCKELVDAAHIVNLKTNEMKKQKKDRKNDNFMMTTEDTDKIIDVTEPRYCICNEVAFGVMVACDNKKCLHEWFHCECVGILNPPKGKWYCPRCFKNMKRRRSRRT